MDSKQFIMLRVFGLLGFTSGFVLISPSLRRSVLEGADVTAGFVQDHTPYSYLAIVVLIFGGITMTLVRGSSPR